MVDQVRAVRADLAVITVGCPVADDLLLLASELATNAILHSRSGHPDREFTVRATLYPGDYASVEVIDQGGAWKPDEYDDEHGRGLAVVDAIAGDGNWGIDGNMACRVVWFRLGWSRPVPGQVLALEPQNSHPSHSRSRAEGAPITHDRYEPIGLDAAKCGNDRTTGYAVLIGQLCYRRQSLLRLPFAILDSCTQRCLNALARQFRRAVSGHSTMIANTV